MTIERLVRRTLNWLWGRERSSVRASTRIGRYALAQLVAVNFKKDAVMRWSPSLEKCNSHTLEPPLDTLLHSLLSTFFFDLAKQPSSHYFLPSNTHRSTLTRSQNLHLCSALSIITSSPYFDVALACFLHTTA